MTALDTFNAYFDAFEATYADDNWDRVARCFAPDMVYLNTDGTLEGRTAAVDYLKADVTAFDRRFDSRAFDGTPDITAHGHEVTMNFTVRYAKEGAPDLVISGQEVATIRDGLIQRMEDRFDDSSLEALERWTEEYGAFLAE